MPVTVSFIMEIDAADNATDRVARWLQHKNIVPELFCTQIRDGQTRLIVMCELEKCSVGLAARRLRKIQGVTSMECLLPKKYTFRDVPPAVLQLLQPHQ